MGQKVVLKNVRISYSHIFQPYGMTDESKKYSVCVIMPKDHPQLKQVNNAIIEAAKEKFASKIKDGKLPASLKNPLRDGEERDEQPEFEGMVFFNASSKNRPQVFDRDKSQLIEEDGKPYSGCYCNLSLNFYPFDASGNKGVAVGLNGVQFLRDGEALAGNANTANDFDVEEVEDDDYSDI